MRQLIARIDDDLHARLKQRARDEGRSLNALVGEILTEAVERDDPRARLRARMKAMGMLIELPTPEGDVPSLDEVIESTRGAGRVISEAIEAERSAR